MADTVALPEEKGAEETLAEELLRRLLAGMGVSAQIEIRRREGNVVLCIEGCNEAGRVIGKDGNVLYQLQFLVNLMLMKKLKTRQTVLVDVEGYRDRRRTRLVARAQEAANKVKQRGKPILLEPMHPADRRIIHLALKDDSLIETSSVNEDRETGMKSVKISLHEEKPPESPAPDAEQEPAP